MQPFVALVENDWIAVRMNWIFVAIYIIGGLASARFFYSVAFKADYEDSLRRGLTDETQIKEFATRSGLFHSWLGLLWPLAWAVAAMVYFLTRTTEYENKLRQAKEEKEFNARAEEEKNRLRDWLRSEDLPVPDDVTLTRLAKENLAP